METELLRNNYSLNESLPKLEKLKKEILINSKQRIYAVPALADSFGLFNKPIKNELIDMPYKISEITFDNNNHIWALSSAGVEKKICKINKTTNSITEISLENYLGGNHAYYLSFDGKETIWVSGTGVFLAINIKTNNIQALNFGIPSPLVFVGDYAFAVIGVSPFSIMKFSTSGNLSFVTPTYSASIINASSTPVQSMTTDGTYIYVSGSTFFGGLSNKTWIRTYNTSLTQISYWESLIDPSFYGSVYFDGTHLWQISYTSTTLRKFSINSGVLTEVTTVAITGVTNNPQPFAFDGNYLYIQLGTIQQNVFQIIDIKTNSIIGTTAIADYILNNDNFLGTQHARHAFDGTYMYNGSETNFIIRKSFLTLK